MDGQRPTEPGRYYLQGRGLNVERAAAGDSAIGRGIRRANDERAERQVALMSGLVTDAGLPNALTATTIADDLAARSEVPSGWVSLQERHIAHAFADLILGLPAGDRQAVLGRLIGATSDIAGAGDLQNALRAALLKHGQAAFVPDSPCPSPTASPWSSSSGNPHLLRGRRWRQPRLRLRDSRGRPRPTDPRRGLPRGGADHRAQHGGLRRGVRRGVPRRRVDRDGGKRAQHAEPPTAGADLPRRPCPGSAAEAFREGTAIVAAHQALVAQGEAGFVDAQGDLVDGGRRAELAGRAAN
ncbi:hypothetical protein G7085_11525 [Tessaracoccus sp. HDW20]|uniref:hypothetical protein n=1 Tax=Tessaracoccus coleopterorum TaxID=2714950 RepID=UPI0018D2A5FC|nr:hypothetical protein [Tessaracoccus coleopterorum]NHB85023.1 hypothetical protein [Tessaracoccus coleopterorum]